MDSININPNAHAEAPDNAGLLHLIENAVFVRVSIKVGAIVRFPENG